MSSIGSDVNYIYIIYITLSNDDIKSNTSITAFYDAENIAS